VPSPVRQDRSTRKRKKSMVLDHENKGANPPVGNVKATHDLIDYFCPHCGGKLFRGKVDEIKMVCPHCNTLVRSFGNQEPEALEETEKPEE